MAEGPLVHYYARQLREVLKGKRVKVRFGARKPKSVKTPLKGLKVRDVEAYGKQFRIRLSDSRVILVHLMMWGSWRIFRKGEPWDRPRSRARLVLTTGSHEAVVFSAPVVRLLSQEELGPGTKWGDLGPDPLRPDFSSREFWKRLGGDPARQIGEALLDQTIISGVGNILRIEILHGARIHPKRTAGSLSRTERRRLLAWTVKLMRRWLDERELEETWIKIYRKGAKPCPRCGAVVDFFRQGGRITYACPGCQA
jgi:endonuclease-8